MAGKILITPNTGSTTTDPKIQFQGTGVSTDITLRSTSDGTLSFEGTTGQLFSISDSMSGTIHSVNDISGIPSIEVLDTGLVKLAQYSGNVVIGSGTDDGVNKVQVTGDMYASAFKSGYVDSSTISGGIVYRVNNTTDSYLRTCTDPAAIRTWLGVVSSSVTEITVTTVSASTHAATATFGTIVLLCNTVGNSITVNLPTAVGNKAIYKIKKIAVANSMIIDAFNAETIDGSSTITVFVENESLTLVSDNTNWRVI